MTNKYNTNNAVIYSIKCKDPTVTFTYFGSTISFTGRKSSHKGNCNNQNSKSYNVNLYKVIRDNGGWDNWEMKIIKVFPCESRVHLAIEEQKYIDKNRDMNCNNAYVSVEDRKERVLTYNIQYRLDNKESIAQYYLDNKESRAQYYLDNKESIASCKAQHWLDNKERISAQQAQYRLDNREHILAKKNSID